jgi:hypothetical protein
MESPPSDPTPTGSSDSSPTKVTIIHGDDTLVTANLLAATVKEWRDWAATTNLKPSVSAAGFSIVEEIVYRADPKRITSRAQFVCRARPKQLAAWTGYSAGHIARELAKLIQPGWIKLLNLRAKSGRRIRCWHVPWPGEDARRRDSDMRAGANLQIAPARTPAPARLADCAGAQTAVARDQNLRAGAHTREFSTSENRAITAAAPPSSSRTTEKMREEAAAVTRTRPDDFENVLAILRFLTHGQSLYPKLSLSAAAAIVTAKRYNRYRGHIPYETWLRIWTDIRTRKGCTNAIGLLTLKLDTGETCEEFVPFGHPATLLENIEERRAAVAKASAPDKPRQQPARSRAAQEMHDHIGDYLGQKGQTT